MTGHDEEKRRACVHEAGHAVLGVKSEASNPERVWIEERDGRWLGRTYKPNPNLDNDEGLAGELTAAWGGCQAEEVVCPPYNRIAASKDQAEIEKMLVAAGIPEAEWSESKLLAKVRANYLVGQYQVAVEAVAFELEQHERIDSESDLRKIIDRALTGGARQGDG